MSCVAVIALASLLYQDTQAPAAIRKAKLDTIALVPASLLPLKGTYQPIANTLPKGNILLVQSQSLGHKRILEEVGVAKD